MATEVNTKRVITPLARLSFARLFKPEKYGDKGELKYSCSLLFDATTDLSSLKAAANAAIEERWGNKPPKGIKMPFKDGDEKDYEGYAGKTFIEARTVDKPGVVIGKDRTPVTNESSVYSGCWVKASVTAFTYDTGANKGVSFALNNVWVIRDGEPFGTARKSAESEFEDADIDEDAFGDAEESLY